VGALAPTGVALSSRRVGTPGLFGRADGRTRVADHLGSQRSALHLEGKALATAVRSEVEELIDRSLNYGRHNIEHFLQQSTPYSTVLDIGAGTGSDLLLARRVTPGARLFALEAHTPTVDTLVSLGIGVTAHELERDGFPFDDESLDVVIANQVLEHTKEIFWILHEISRTLRVGGRIILGVPNLASLHNRLLLVVGKQPSPIKSFSAHVRGFTRGDMVGLLNSCFPGGYRLIDFRGSNFYPFPAIVARPLARAFPTLAWGIFFLFEKTRHYDRECIDAVVRSEFETPFYLGPG